MAAGKRERGERRQRLLPTCMLLAQLEDALRLAREVRAHFREVRRRILLSRRRNKQRAK